MNPARSTAVHQRLDAITVILPALEQYLLELQTGELQVDSKCNPFDLVTQADVASEQQLVRFIREQFPEDGIIAEEGSPSDDETTRDQGFRWILDPIDGTINYANRLPLWAISIGLLYGAEPVGALVCGPGLRLRYRAVRGEGASCNGTPIAINQNAKLREGVVVTGFPYDRAQRATPSARHWATCCAPQAVCVALVRPHWIFASSRMGAAPGIMKWASSPGTWPQVA